MKATDKVINSYLRRVTRAINYEVDPITNSLFSSGTRVDDTEAALKLGEAFSDRIVKDTLSMIAAPRTTGVLQWWLTSPSFYKGELPANEIGLAILNCCSWVNILHARLESGQDEGADGRKLIDALSTKINFLDITGSVTSKLALEDFDPAVTPEYADIEARLLELDRLASLFVSEFKRQAELSIPAATHLPTARIAKGSVSSGAIPLLDYAYSLVSLANETFGTLKDGIFVQPISLVLHSMAGYQNKVIAELANFVADPVLYVTTTKLRYELPETLTKNNVGNALKQLALIDAHKEAVLKLRELSGNLMSIVGSQNKNYGMGASLFTLDLDAFSTCFQTVIANYTKVCTDLSLKVSKFETHVSRLSEFFRFCEVAEALGYDGVDKFRLSDEEKVISRLFLSDWTQTYTLTETQYREEKTLSISTIRPYIPLLLSCYEKLSFRDVSVGYTLYVKGDLATREAYAVSRSVYEKEHFFTAEPHFFRNSNDPKKSVRISELNVEPFSPNELCFNKKALIVNKYLDTNSFGTKWTSPTGFSIKCFGNISYLAKTFKADRRYWVCTPNDHLHCVNFQQFTRAVFFIRPYFNIVNEQAKSGNKFMFHLGINAPDTAARSTEMTEFSASTISLMEDKPSQALLPYYMLAIIEGIPYGSSVSTSLYGTDRLDFRKLNACYVNLLELRTSTPKTFDQVEAGIDLTSHADITVSSDSNIPVGSDIITDSNKPLKFCGSELANAMNSGLTELSVIARDDRKLAATVYRVVLYNYLPPVLADLLKGGPDRYRKAIPNGLYLNNSKLTLTKRLPLFSLPKELRDVLNASSKATFTFNGRTVAEACFATDTSGIIYDESLGALVDLSVTLCDHEEQEKTNLHCAAGASIKNVTSKKDNAFWYAVKYGKDGLDITTSSGPTISGARLYGSKSPALAGVCKFLFNFNTILTPYDLTLSPIMIESLRIAANRATDPSDAALDLVDESLFAARIYIAYLCASAFYTEKGVIISDYHNTVYNPKALVSNLRAFNTELLRMFSGDDKLNEIGLLDSQKTVDELANLISACCRNPNEKSLRELLSVLDPAAVNLCDSLVKHGENQVNYYPVTSEEIDSNGTALVKKLFSDEIVYYIPATTMIDDIVNFGENWMGETAASSFKVSAKAIYNSKFRRALAQYGLTSASFSVPGYLASLKATDGDDAEIVIKRGFILIRLPGTRFDAVLKQDDGTYIEVPSRTSDLPSDINTIWLKDKSKHTAKYYQYGVLAKTAEGWKFTKSVDIKALYVADESKRNLFGDMIDEAGFITSESDFEKAQKIADDNGVTLS